MARVRFVSPTFFGDVSYAKNQVVDLPNDTVQALGDSVERADDRDIEEEVEENLSTVVDPNTRTELDVNREPGDAQDIPDALRDEEENARQEAQARDLEQAKANAEDHPQVNKQVQNAPRKK